MMTTQKAVAMRISKLLIEKNMTQYSLSVKSGISKQGIANIINEKYNTIKLDTIIKVADGFNMTLQEFVDDKVFVRANLDIK
ncbi:MAG: helix-turn-helix transcriptional regulator [Clostridia bacterium]|nr:helix-turn-helix transcriptional regulator [Clostridia bacterium]